ERERARERELEQAREIERAYHELRDAQAQLVQQEKMASLGQLTAGIAHEIKNPLNFVNNFAALSKELVDELEEETDPTERAALLADLKANAAKIEEHGQRADAIVRAMLEHSRGGAGERQTVKLNALVDDYVNLAYHGMRARRVDFEVALTQDLAEDVGHVEVVPQDIGRVLVNLLNNAFDAVYERAMRQDGPYVPAVKVSTRRENGQAEVRVEDNGTGIPVEVREKIFEPFFTTKPTGEGTGLGLSMSYDIVTQGHKGTLVVENGAREGVTFVVALPAEGGAAGPSPDRRA
ncbi:MAG: ATP-binding protein, partial [Rubricoccaceae bacterium]|nr:ATP-binding protein [Rubricoccaceae bacterium]